MPTPGAERPERVLSLMAHPDDAEVFCAGTLILLKRAGFEPHIASMTPGDCGSTQHSASEVSRIRRAEGKAAAARIGATYHCADLRDLAVCYDRASIETVIELVRELRPSIVITHAPHDYLPDHEMTSLLARNAAFGASAPNFDTGRRPAAAATERIPHLYYASPAGAMDIYGEPVASNLYVDVSSVIAEKIEMLACHESQREWLRAQHGMDEYIETFRAWSREVGEAAGTEHAEGFRQHRGHPYPQDDRLGELLAPYRRTADA